MDLVVREPVACRRNVGGTGFLQRPAGRGTSFSVQKVFAMAPKPVKDVKTFDGKLHEVDIRHKDKSYTAWAFVDGKMIESRKASTQDKAIVSWKTEYQTAISGEAPAPKKPRVKKAKAEAAAPEATPEAETAPDQPETAPEQEAAADQEVVAEEVDTPTA